MDSRCCKELGNTNICVAGMNFNGGYLYQQKALRIKSTFEENKNIAINYYNNVLELYPDNPSANSNIIKLLEMNGVNESTIGRMEELAEKYPSKKVEYLVRIGNLYMEEEDFGAGL